MNFLIFRDFYEFIFDFSKNLKRLKKGKKGLFFTRVSRGCDVARKATWQSHAAPTWRDIYIYLLIWFMIYSLPLIGRELLPPITAAPYKPVGFPKFTLCGTNLLISCKIDRWIKARDASCVDTVDTRTTGSTINARALKFT